MKTYIYDGLLGGVLLGVISYLSGLYGKSYNHFYKILGFIWAVPLTFFFFIYLSSKDGKNAIKDFSQHTIIGTLLTLVCASILLFMLDYEKNMIILFTFIYGIITTFLYFYYNIYEFSV
tara:strand:+ start:114 stop:470 length:357 start_codon:yes stop_codon:yes gene_type:complete